MEGHSASIFSVEFCSEIEGGRKKFLLVGYTAHYVSYTGTRKRLASTVNYRDILKPEIVIF
jgi:hypothetical protein